MGNKLIWQLIGKITKAIWSILIKFEEISRTLTNNGRHLEKILFQHRDFDQNETKSSLNAF
ncbi:hypothetical protein JYB64_04660 [Algoriphagus aestuarii]|nr:hypothetical protein [Algoriphagus aestuarii]